LIALPSLVACGPEVPGTGLEIEVVNELPGATAPTHLLVDWLDGERFLRRDIRVPAAGALDPGSSPLARIRIEAPDGANGVRRTVVRGMVGESVVSEGTGTGMVTAGTWDVVTVSLASGRRPDRDLDGVPDSIDGCPEDGARNDLCAPGAPRPDAAAPAADASAAPGAGAGATADATADVAPAESDAGADGGEPPPPPPDAAPQPIGPPQSFDCGSVLMVVGTSNNLGDRAVQLRLRLMGCTVVTIDDTAVTAASASGRSVVIVSDTAVPGQTKSKLKLVTAGLINMQAQLLDDHSLNGQEQSTAWDYSPAAAAVTILDPAHPIAAGAGLTGTTALFSEPAMVAWGAPDAPSAQRIAALAEDPGHSLVFAFEKGATMSFATVASGRRVAFPVSREGVTRLNRAGWFLFDAIVRWAAGK
jgi:hypothetical protein